MNKALIVPLFVLGVPFMALAAEDCSVGTAAQQVQTSPGSPAIPVVTHQECTGGYWTGSWPHIHWVAPSCHTVVDSPAVPAVPATYETQCVADPDYVPPPVETPDDTDIPTPPPAPPVMGSGPPVCLLQGTCPCFGLSGDFLNACVAQKYPGGKMCELVPVKSCFGQLNCVPEAPKCAGMPETPVSPLSALQEALSKLTVALASLLALV